MMDPVIIEGVDITRELLAEFERGWHFDAVQARLRQQAAAAEREALGLEGRPGAAAGELAYQVDPFWYHYWGRRESYEIFGDEREMERFAQDTPEIRVRRAKRPLVQGWDGGRSDGETVGRSDGPDGRTVGLLDGFGRPVEGVA